MTFQNAEKLLERTSEKPATLVVGLQHAPAPDYAEHRIISSKAVCELTSIGKSQIHHLVSISRFPPPIRLSEGRVGWREIEVLTWIDERIAERDRLQSERLAAVDAAPQQARQA